MSDWYRDFANSGFGTTITKQLGLPRPGKLRRYVPGEPLLPGPVVIGSAGEGRLRETVAAKLTRDAANNSLKVALASAVVDHIPLVGIVLGAFASAGDMVAITGIQMMLLLHIQAAYGKDPDVQRMWQLLPVIGGGFGWRMLARELSGFVPVAGIAIKGAIAYAGTIVVGEGATFFLEHGRHMSKEDATKMYERTKSDAMRFAREFATRFTK